MLEGAGTLQVVNKPGYPLFCGLSHHGYCPLLTLQSQPLQLSKDIGHGLGAFPWGVCNLTPHPPDLPRPFVVGFAATSNSSKHVSHVLKTGSGK